MTHGCLIIQAKGDARRVFLHTYHTGMDIPLAVENAPRVLAEYQSYLADRHGQRNREQLYDLVNCGVIDADRFSYAPSAAALIICAMPGFLEPMPTTFIKDLPKWGGQDEPLRLRVERDRWLLRDGKNVLLDFDPIQRLVDLHLLRQLGGSPIA